MWENIGKPMEKYEETPWEKQWELSPGKYIGNTLEKNIDTFSSMKHLGKSWENP